MVLTTCVVALFARFISLPHTADLQHTQNKRNGQPANPHMQKALQRVYDTVAGLEKAPQEKEAATFETRRTVQASGTDVYI